MRRQPQEGTFDSSLPRVLLLRFMAEHCRRNYDTMRRIGTCQSRREAAKLEAHQWELVQEQALTIVRKSSRFFNALQHEAMTAPVADRLLRLCGVPRVQYLARVGLLGEYEDALDYFDDQVQTAAQQQAGTGDENPDPALIAQQAAPLRHAGFAFRTYNGNVALYASLGAFANAAPHLLRVCQSGLPHLRNID